MGLPSDNAARKALPLWDYLFNYFPDTWVEETRVAVEGNKQHNPGEPLHWAREKSKDQLNTAMRHLFDHSQGQVLDTDGTYHLAKAIWRLRAELQLLIERRAGNEVPKPELPPQLIAGAAISEEALLAALQAPPGAITYGPPVLGELRRMSALGDGPLLPEAPGELDLTARAPVTED